MEIYGELNKNLKYFKKFFTSKDITFFKYKINNQTNCILIYVESLTDKESVSNFIIKPLSEYQGKIQQKAINGALLSPTKEMQTDLDKVKEEILLGKTALLIDGINKCFVFGLQKFEQRSIAEPPTSAIIKGPREGFVENIETNISLMRRKLKTPDLIIDTVKVGKFSSTPVSIVYIKGIVQDGLVDGIKKKLEMISIDAILDSSYIADFLGEHPTSIFKQAGTTEKPDILSAKILEGRIGILVDGSPIALSIPYMIWEDFQSESDYFVASYKALLSRMIRLISVMISILLPAFYVSALLFHLQLLPLSFLLTIVNSVKGIPLSPSFEMFFTLLIFIILSGASERIPKNVGMIISIVGGLVLGETAVNAGIISAPALMIVALSGICLYTVPDLEKPFALIRLMLLLIAGSIGGYGLVLSGAYLLIYLTTFENYGTPILAPFSPFIIEDQKDGIYKDMLLGIKKRPVALKSNNKTRLRDEVK